MLRPVAAGWMCLGFVTLGVAAFAGQEEERKREGDVIAIEGEVREAAAGAVAPRSAEEAKLIDIKIGDDGRAAVAVDGETRRIEVREGGDVIILNGDDGRIVERIQAGPQPGLFSMRARFAGAPAIDPGTREAVDKLIAGLKDEAKRLAGDGKKEEAEKKMQSIQALEQMLNSGPRWGAMVGQPVPSGGVMAGGFARFGEGGPAAEELKKLHARLEELRAQASKRQEGEKHAKTQEEIARIQKQIAEKHQRLMAEHPGMGPFAPGTPGAPGAPMAPFAPGTHVQFRRWAGGHQMAGDARVDALMHKAQALSQAADQLRGAGLQNQARGLDEQAEKLKAEAAEVRSQAEKAMKAEGLGGMDMGFGGGPPMELQRSIRELQEQIQQLRKEVGELRELLQRRQ